MTYGGFKISNVECGSDALAELVDGGVETKIIFQGLVVEAAAASRVTSICWPTSLLK